MERILDFYSHAADPSNKVRDKQNFFLNGEARGFFQAAVYERRNGVDGYYVMGLSDRWMGDMAWLLTAYKYYEREFGPERYEKVTGLLKELLLSWFKDEGDAGYVQHGWRRADEKLHEPFGHHEGNIDAYAVMNLCGEPGLARKIRRWLDRSIQGADLPLDLYTWRVLAYGPKYAYLLNIPDGDPRFRKTLKIHDAAVTGFFHRPDIGASNIWLDGTGHMACAFITVGDRSRGRFYANQLDAFLVDRRVGDRLTRSLPYTANRQNYEWVDTSKGFVSAAAWYIFAKNLFNPLTLEKFEDTAPRIPNPYPPFLGGASESQDPFARVETWQKMADKNTQLSVRTEGAEIVVDYAFNEGGWGLVRKESEVWNRLLDKSVRFELKTEGPPNTLELKLVTANDSVFGWRLTGSERREYAPYAVKLRDFRYWWGEDRNLSGIKYFDIALSKLVGGSGRVCIRNLRIE